MPKASITMRVATRRARALLRTASGVIEPEREEKLRRGACVARRCARGRPRPRRAHRASSGGGRHSRADRASRAEAALRPRWRPSAARRAPLSCALSRARATAGFSTSSPKPQSASPCRTAGSSSTSAQQRNSSGSPSRCMPCRASRPTRSSIACASWVSALGMRRSSPNLLRPGRPRDSWTARKLFRT